MPHYATNLVVQQAIQTASRLGVPRQDMLDYLGVDEKSLLRPGGMVPSPILIDAIEYGAQRAGLKDFGLRVADEIPQGIFAGIAILLSHCRTLGEAADTIVERFHVINSAVAIEVVPGDAGRTITLHLLCNGRNPPVHYTEMQVAMVLRLVSFLAGRDWHPEMLRLPFAPQSSPDRYRKEFGCPVEFETGRTSFLMGKADADLPVAVDQLNLQALVLKAFDSLAGRTPKAAQEFPDEVARIVGGLLSRGQASASAVAAAMNMSTRSLQRRLSAHGVTLKSIIEAERARLAGERAPAPAPTTKKA